jgi:ABC-2 type transport system ATP-binding protein
MIKVEGLTKRYARNVAVDHVSFEVEKGQIVGFLGPNGAGKTTTILMLLGLTEPTGGSVSILGKDPLRQPLDVKREVGYLPDTVGFYDAMTGRENLAYTARLADIPRGEVDDRIGRALETVRLADVADRPAGTYSRGMRQRLGIAELLMRQCRIAILDEPTSGLDPQSTHELLGLIQRLSRDGMTILLSSHMLDVVQTVCHRVALFNQGRIGFFGTLEELAARIGGGAWIIDIEAEDVEVSSLAAAVQGVKNVAPSGDGHWQCEAEHDVRPELARRIVAAGGKLRNLDLRRTRLDEAYSRFFREVHSHAA